ncbi:MAG TPA: CpaD family pilus assembly lipoprotein [Alphaproteobacteria bacterium]|nr:CpaD family pilus assembly lipoprotein [Alphaproteobacteria bacterium]
MMLPRDSMMLFFPLLLAAALLVTGCQDTERWTPTEAPKENRVDFVTMVHKVEFAPGTANPQTGEDRKLADFLSQVNFGYGDQLTLDAGPKASDKAADQLAEKRLDAVSKLLHKMRAPATVASRPSVDGALSPNAVVVTLGRYVVTPPACPDWTKPEADDFTNVPASNYGCATNTNFGLMVANPAELVRGSSEGGADGDYGATGIEHYRNGDVSKSLKPELPKLYSGGGGN